jgi:integrase
LYKVIQTKNSTLFRSSVSSAKPFHRFNRQFGPPKTSLPLLAHPHMLRHACGFALANQGADTRLIQASAMALPQTETTSVAHSVADDSCEVRGPWVMPPLGALC